MMVKEYVAGLDMTSIRTLIADFEQFERDGSIGDCALRATASHLLPVASASIVAWMHDVAFECYRRVAKRSVDPEVACAVADSWLSELDRRCDGQWHEVSMDPELSKQLSLLDRSTKDNPLRKVKP